MQSWFGRQVFIHVLGDGSLELQKPKEGDDKGRIFDNTPEGLRLLWRTLIKSGRQVRWSSLALPIGEDEGFVETAIMRVDKDGKERSHIFQPEQLKAHKPKSFWLAKRNYPAPVLMAFQTDRPNRNGSNRSAPLLVRASDGNSGHVGNIKPDPREQKPRSAELVRATEDDED